MGWWMIAALILQLLLVLAFITAFLLYELGLNPKRKKSRVFDASHNQIPRVEEYRKRAEELKAWWADIPHESAHIQAFDGLRLHAHCAANPAGGSGWALVCHGYTGRGETMLGVARRYYEAGYSVLMPDLRGHGESEGHYIGMGWHDRLDVLGWIGFILAREPEARIVLHGISMGAAAVIMACGEALPDNVTAAISDCGFSSVWEEFAYQLKALFGLPPFPVMYLADLITRVRAGYSFKEASAVKQLKKARVPILFIHGTQDSFVPFRMLDEVYAACASPKEKYPVPGAGHGAAARVAGEAYWEKVFGFIRLAEERRG